MLGKQSFLFKAQVDVLISVYSNMGLLGDVLRPYGTVIQKTVTQKYEQCSFEKEKSQDSQH